MIPTSFPSLRTISGLGTRGRAILIVLDSVFALQLVKGLNHSVMRRAVRDDPYFVPVVAHYFRLGNEGTRVLELVRQTVHVVGIVVGPFAVTGGLVVPAAAREPRRLRMVGPGQGAVADAVAVHVLVAREAAGTLQLFRGQHLAA